MKFRSSIFFFSVVLKKKKDSFFFFHQTFSRGVISHTHAFASPTLLPHHATLTVAHKKTGICHEEKTKINKNEINK